MPLARNRDILLDPFLGLGSTINAAEATDRVCRGAEFDASYFGVAAAPSHWRGQEFDSPRASRLVDRFRHLLLELHTGNVGEASCLRRFGETCETRLRFSPQVGRPFEELRRLRIRNKCSYVSTCVELFSLFDLQELPRHEGLLQLHDAAGISHMLVHYPPRRIAVAVAQRRHQAQLI